MGANKALEGHSGKKIRCDRARAAAAAFVCSVCEDRVFGGSAFDDTAETAGIGDIDKAFAEAVGKGTLTYLVNIDEILRVQSDIAPDKLDKMVRAVLRTAIWQIFYSSRIPRHAVCDESVRIAEVLVNSGAASYVNGVLRNIIRAEDVLRKRFVTEPAAYHLRCSMPPELAGYFKKWLGKERAIALSDAFHEVPPLCIRANRLRTNPEELSEKLRAEGYEVLPPAFIPDALILKTGGKPLSGSKVFAEGLFAVQDEAAMLTAVLADPKPGQIVADLCSAPGGKACHMAELMDNRGEIAALDIHESRLRLIEENYRRLGIGIIRCRPADAREAALGDIGGRPADMVLADVPCSGLGVLRRKPDILLNMTHERITGLYPLQKAILDRAAALTRPGGMLVYSTCTLNPAENEGRIDTFLAEQGGAFEPADFSHLLPKRLAESDPGLPETARIGRITLFPDRHGCDGFFIAKMRRVP